MKNVTLILFLINPGVIRNKLKINAVIFNANKILEIQKKYGSFNNWLDKNMTKELDLQVNLFNKNFKFTGLK